MNRLVAQFRLLIKNTPESLMLGCVTTKGRIEYQFRLYGTLTLLFAEVKLSTDTLEDYLNAIAQVFAEADACDLMKNEAHFCSPIYAILCDGNRFDFFMFNNYADILKLSRGVLKWHEIPQIRLPHYERAERLAFVKALRPICEYFYSILLPGYITGLQHYTTRSQEISMKDERLKESVPAWARSVALGEEALKKGLEAAEMAKEVGAKDKADELATEGLEALKYSVNLTPPYNRDDCNLMEVWDHSL